VADTRKPICLLCRKTLRKYTHYYRSALDDVASRPTPRVGDVVEIHKGKTVLVRAVYCRKVKFGEKVGEKVAVWAGCYGAYGDDRFCSVTCGHLWAVKNSRPLFVEVSEV
jgi:hypothetical protein